MNSNSEPSPRPIPPDSMNAFAYLTRPDPELTAEEEDALSLELSTAYRMDEAAASSAEVRHIAEKVRARMERRDAEEAASTRDP